MGQDKWDKERAINAALSTQCEDAEGSCQRLVHKELEKATGFLNHLAMTFEDITPFLKGFYLTLKSWRPDRNNQDWKLPRREWKRFAVAKVEEGSFNQAYVERQGMDDDRAPATVTGSPRLASGVGALLRLMQQRNLPM